MSTKTLIFITLLTFPGLTRADERGCYVDLAPQETCRSSPIRCSQNKAQNLDMYGAAAGTLCIQQVLLSQRITELEGNITALEESKGNLVRENQACYDVALLLVEHIDTLTRKIKKLSRKRNCKTTR